MNTSFSVCVELFLVISLFMYIVLIHEPDLSLLPCVFCIFIELTEKQSIRFLNETNHR